jgi:hypothetical protein
VRGFVVAESAAEARAALRSLTSDARRRPGATRIRRARSSRRKGHAWQAGGALALDDRRNGRG